MSGTLVECANAVDYHVGKMIRGLRRAKGVSQVKLAVALGVTFQQIHKYENGSNRISASKMFEAAQFLGVTPAVFFEGLEGASTTAIPQASAEFFTLAGALEIAEAFPKLSPGERRSVTALVISMAEEKALA